MTVKELIERLQQEDPDQLVYFQGSEWDEPVDGVIQGKTTVSEWKQVPQLEFFGGGTRSERTIVEKAVVLLI